MKNNKLKLSLATLTITGLVFTSFGLVQAQEYNYVDTSGNIRTEVADTPAEAISKATNIAPNSGVMEVEFFGETIFPFTTVNTNPVQVGVGQELYSYVDVSGNLQTVIANSPQEAINKATNIATHSGVILIIR